ncbi:hypothetical protein [Streptomyces tendae]
MVSDWPTHTGMLFCRANAVVASCSSRVMKCRSRSTDIPLLCTAPVRLPSASMLDVPTF